MVNLSLFSQIVKALVKTFDENTAIKFVRHNIPFIEQEVLGSASKIDDILILPLLNVLKYTVNFNDRDEKENNKVGMGSGGGR